MPAEAYGFIELLAPRFIAGISYCLANEAMTLRYPEEHATLGVGPIANGRGSIGEEFDAYDEIGTGPDARGPAMLLIEEGPKTWAVRQIFDDPEGDHDWGISATVDLADSDAEGTAVVHVTDVGPL